MLTGKDVWVVTASLYLDNQVSSENKQPFVFLLLFPIEF